MLKTILFSFILFANILFAQKNNIGYVVEYSNRLSINFTTYNPPLRINKVEEFKDIEYGSVEGLLKSYLSASDINWARKEYLNDSIIIGRDSEHFEAVKKATLEDYIQLESVYRFNHGERQMAYVKYSFIFKKLPFPLVSIASMEYVNNRWYFSSLLNQGAVYNLLSKHNTRFLIDCFNGNSKISNWGNLIQKSKNQDGLLEIAILNRNLEDLKKSNSKFYTELKDERLVNKSVNFRNASLETKADEYEFQVYHPFIFKNLQLVGYKDVQKEIVRDENSLNKFAGKPELSLLSNIPIQLLNKVIAMTDTKEYLIIKYKRNGSKKVALFIRKDGKYIQIEDSKTRTIKELVLICKEPFLENILQNKISSLSEFIEGSDGGINIDLALNYLKENEANFLKFLDKN